MQELNSMFLKQGSLNLLHQFLIMASLLLIANNPFNCWKKDVLVQLFDKMLRILSIKLFLRCCL